MYAQIVHNTVSNSYWFAIYDQGTFIHGSKLNYAYKVEAEKAASEWIDSQFTKV